MRTKTLLLTAALGAASLTSSMAQVYSVNMVGYINLTIHPGLQLIANQLNASPNNAVQTLFGTPPGPITVFKFNGSGYDAAAYDPDAGGWSDPTSMVLNTGQGGFVDNPGAQFTQTFVGEVQLVSSLPLNPGLQVISSVIPQSLPLDNPAMNFPATQMGAFTLFRYQGGVPPYAPFTYDPDAGGWNPNAPTPAIGEAFFLDNAGSAATWSRNFPVGP